MTKVVFLELLELEKIFRSESAVLIKNFQNFFPFFLTIKTDEVCKRNREENAPKFFIIIMILDRLVDANARLPWNIFFEPSV